MQQEQLYCVLCIIKKKSSYNLRYVRMIVISRRSAQEQKMSTAFPKIWNMHTVDNEAFACILVLCCVNWLWQSSDYESHTCSKALWAAGKAGWFYLTVERFRSRGGRCGWWCCGVVCVTHAMCALQRTVSYFIHSLYRCICAKIRRFSNNSDYFFFSFVLPPVWNDDYVLESARSVLYVFEKPSIKMLSNVFVFFSPILVMWNILKCCWIQIKIQCEYNKESKFVLRVFINTNVFLFT